MLGEDRPLLDQEIPAGPGSSGWEGPAVTGGRRAVGSLLAVDPAHEPEAASDVFDATADAAALPLSGSGTLITALAPDALTLRKRLDAGLAAIVAGHAAAP